MGISGYLYVQGMEISVYLYSQGMDISGYLYVPGMDIRISIYSECAHFRIYAVVGDYINAMKTDFDFNFDFN